MLKEVKDYIPELQKKFPYLCKKDIKTIVDYGWRALYYYTLFGCDTLVTKQGFWCYIGFLTKDSFKHFNYYIKKLCRKIKMIYRKNKGIKDWDGYYYIGLNEEEYTLFKKSRTSSGQDFLFWVRNIVQEGNNLIRSNSLDFLKKLEKSR